MPSRIGPSTRRRERRKSVVGSVRSPISTSITGTSREVTARAAASTSAGVAATRIEWRSQKSHFGTC